MPRGKQTCKILKEIRKQIAAENDIELVISECTYQGDCLGTCPKCDAEVRYLERELEKRQRLGKAVAIAGLSVGMLGALPEAVAQQPDSTMMLDTIEEEIEEIGLMGCVQDIQPEFVGGDIHNIASAEVENITLETLELNEGEIQEALREEEADSIEDLEIMLRLLDYNPTGDGILTSLMLIKIILEKKSILNIKEQEILHLMN